MAAMTALDALAHQQRDASNAVLQRLDDLGDLVLISRRAVTIGACPSIAAMRVRLTAIEEAWEIYEAISTALRNHTNAVKGAM